jgi:nucleotide-binding universal stress UspA family protein
VDDAMSSSRFARVLVAIDGSPFSEEALEAAIDLAARYRSELTVLAVAPLVPVYLPSASPYVVQPVAHAERKQYQELVDSAVKLAREQAVSSAQGVCLEGVVVDEILSYLDRNSFDIVVVGSRGLSATKRLLIGSVSSALVTHAPCPVLVVRGASSTKPAG